MQAQRALEIGLADEIAEPGTLIEAALRIAEALERSAPLAIASIKAAMSAEIEDLESSFRIEDKQQPALSLSRDRAEALDAFREKRSPNFIGE